MSKRGRKSAVRAIDFSDSVGTKTFAASAPVEINRVEFEIVDGELKRNETPQQKLQRLKVEVKQLHDEMLVAATSQATQQQVNGSVCVYTTEVVCVLKADLDPVSIASQLADLQTFLQSVAIKETSVSTTTSTTAVVSTTGGGAAVDSTGIAAQRLLQSIDYFRAGTSASASTTTSTATTSTTTTADAVECHFVRVCVLT
jgi:hypothetical protein